MPFIFILTVLAVIAALGVLAAALIFVVCVALGALSMFVGDHERDIRTLENAADICKKAVKKGADNVK